MSPRRIVLLLLVALAIAGAAWWLVAGGEPAPAPEATETREALRTDEGAPASASEPAPDEVPSRALESVARIRGRLCLPSGGAAAGAKVSRLEPNPKPEQKTELGGGLFANATFKNAATATCDGTGRFEFPAPPRGPCTILAHDVIDDALHLAYVELEYDGSDLDLGDCVLGTSGTPEERRRTSLRCSVALAVGGVEYPLEGEQLQLALATDRPLKELRLGTGRDGACAVRGLPAFARPGVLRLSSRRFAEHPAFRGWSAAAFRIDPSFASIDADDAEAAFRIHAVEELAIRAVEIEYEGDADLHDCVLCFIAPLGPGIEATQSLGAVPLASVPSHSKQVVALPAGADRFVELDLIRSRATGLGEFDATFLRNVRVRLLPVGAKGKLFETSVIAPPAVAEGRATRAEHPDGVVLRVHFTEKDRVAAYEVRGRLLNRGVPVAGHELCLARYFRAEAVARTDPDGRFSFGSVARNSYGLHVRPLWPDPATPAPSADAPYRRFTPDPKLKPRSLDVSANLDLGDLELASFDR